MMYYFLVVLVALMTVYASLKAMILMPIFGKHKFLEESIRWSEALLKLFKIEVKYEYEEEISSNESYVFVSNHTSLFDIPLLLTTFKRDVRIIYKKELEKIPFFGWGLKQSPYIAVERTNPREAMSSLETALSTLDTGASIIVFPEGTRNREGQVQAFKRGAFMVATKSGKKIVPIAIDGAWKIISQNPKKFIPQTITMKVGKALDPKEFTDKELMAKVEEIIKNKLNQ